MSRFTLTEPTLDTRGIEVIGNKILFFASRRTGRATTLPFTAPQEPSYITFRVAIALEGEGLSIDEATRTVYVGTHYPNRVDRMSPAFTSNALLE
jgi:hypothetical protein